MSTTKTKVKETAIPFKAPLVRAILEGRKTQTRRILNEQPLEKLNGRWSWIASSSERSEAGKFQYSWPDPDGNAFTIRGREQAVRYRCPYGSVGDRLWVKETARVESETTGPDPWHAIEYAAGGSKVQRGSLPGKWFPSVSRNKDQSQRWHPSIFMPRWASRITLEITGVRVDRLNDINEADALAEGCDGNCQIGYIPAYQAGPCVYHFAHLWESINGPGSWALNPWVWVIEFKRIGDL